VLNIVFNKPFIDDSASREEVENCAKSLDMSTNDYAVLCTPLLKSQS
jgi:hypothetical protein